LAARGYDVGINMAAPTIEMQGSSMAGDLCAAVGWQNPLPALWAQLGLFSGVCHLVRGQILLVNILFGATSMITLVGLRLQQTQ
jgi:hypothetical protein